MAFSAKIANSVLNSKPMQYLTKPNAAGAAATIAIISNTSKDAVNCYYYVTQSLGNKKIPEDKRKFVAALDLSNGILNIITQLTLGLMLKKPVEKFFDKKIAPKFFSEKAADQMREKLKLNMSSEKFYGRFSRNRGYAKVGMAVISTLVVTQIIAKRIIVPLIATPMASIFKKKFEQGSAAKSPATAQASTPAPATASEIVTNQPQVQTQATSNTQGVLEQNGKQTPDCFKPFK